MMLSRRQLLALGGGGIAALTTMGPAGAADTAPAPVVEITMRGTSRGERVWFSPQGVAVAAGSMIRFTNQDAGNTHTSTAYHPDLYDRQLRIPSLAKPWDSDFIYPNQSYQITLTRPGVYDYYCLPHEMAAMVGRIVVGRPEDTGWQGPAPDSPDLLPDVLAAFPSVALILSQGRVDPEGIT